MIQSFVIALCSLVIVLFVQTRLEARKIRLNRSVALDPANREMVLYRRI